MPLAEYSLHGDIAVIRFNNPPMNTLALAMRTEVYELLETAIADPAVKAIVVTGGGRAYCSGAEIREFNTPKTTTFPMSRDLIAAFEESLKPVIAACNGPAVGVGATMQLAMDIRLASAEARYGFVFARHAGERRRGGEALLQPPPHRRRRRR